MFLVIMCDNLFQIVKPTNNVFPFRSHRARLVACINPRPARCNLPCLDACISYWAKPTRPSKQRSARPDGHARFGRSRGAWPGRAQHATKLSTGCTRGEGRETHPYPLSDSSLPTVTAHPSVSLTSHQLSSKKPMAGEPPPPPPPSLDPAPSLLPGRPP